MMPSNVMPPRNGNRRSPSSTIQGVTRTAAYNNSTKHTERSSTGSRFRRRRIPDIRPKPANRKSTVPRKCRIAPTWITLVNWLYYGDNGKVHQEPGKVTERFPEGLPGRSGKLDT